MKKRKAFTLIELLIAATVLGSLATISVLPMVKSQMLANNAIELKEDMSRLIKEENKIYFNYGYYDTVSYQSVDAQPDNYVVTDNLGLKFYLKRYAMFEIIQETCNDDSDGFTMKYEYKSLNFIYHSCTDKTIKKI